MDKTEILKQIITAYLQFNERPSDQQFHALAASLGVDHEYLESISYAMLADDQQQAPQPATASGDVEPLSEAQEVLDGEYDPNTTSGNDLVLNDGAPAGTSGDQASQDALYDDGVGADDTGVDIFGDKDALISDGTAPVQLKAALRLKQE